MRHSTGQPTKAESVRFDKLKALGCVACRLDGNGRDGMEPQIHHFLSGNKRIGHAATVPLCYWHHNGLPYDGVPSEWFLKTLGPSFHKHTRAFRAKYGQDADLLALVNSMIDNGEQ